MLPEALERALHKTIKKVTDDISGMRFNTAISALMELTNLMISHDPVPRQAAQTLITLLSPFAPHMCEELNQRLGSDVCLATGDWPTFDPAKCEESTVEVGVQVNGKRRGAVQLPRGASQDDAKQAAMAVANVASYVEGKELRKFIYVPGRIINFVVGMVGK